MHRANTRQQTDNWVAHGNRWTDIDITIRKLCRRENETARKRERKIYSTSLISQTGVRYGLCGSFSCELHLFRVQDTPRVDTLNPRLFVPAVVQRAVRVVPPTADVFPNCLRQRLRELTRRNHLLLAPRSSTVRTNSQCWGFGGRVDQLLFCGERFWITESILTWCFQRPVPTKRPRERERERKRENSYCPLWI